MRILFCLIPKFSMLSLCTALEPLRIANRISGKELFDWSLCTETSDVRSSLGFSVPIREGLPPVKSRDIIIVCAGPSVERFRSQLLLEWLRKATMHGATVGGLFTGTHMLALAGLLEGKKVSILQEEHDRFQEKFSDVRVSVSPYSIDGKFLTASGGISAMDLMLALIAHHAGADLARNVCKHLMYKSPQPFQTFPKIHGREPADALHPKVQEVISLMANALDQPLNVKELADRADISPRQLQRFFKSDLSQSPLQYYLDLRLMHARDLLYQTSMSVREVSSACGFASQSTFSKRFRHRFGVSPMVLRKASALSADNKG